MSRLWHSLGVCGGRRASSWVPTGMTPSHGPMTITKTPGLITPIGWIYVSLGMAFLAVALFRVQVGPVPLGPKDSVVPLLIILAGVGAILRKPWGRWFAYIVSALFLLGVPIGTLLGGFMIYHLTIYRDQFHRPKPAVPSRRDDIAGG